MPDGQHKLASESGHADPDIGRKLGIDRVLMRHSRWVEGFAKRGARMNLDGRSAEAKFMNRVRDELIAQVGGHPSTTTLALIDRAAWLSLHCARIDMRAIENGSMNAHARREYLAFSNALARLLRQLQSMQAPPDKCTLRDLLMQDRPHGTAT